MFQLSPGVLAVLDRTRRWGTWIFLALFLIAYVALSTGLITSPEPVVALGILVAVGALSLLESTHRRVDEVLALRETEMSGRLLKITDCYEDLSRRLGALRRRRALEIDHLGLSLSQAQGYFQRLWGQHGGQVSELRLRVLMLCGEAETIGPGPPPEVREWCRQAAATRPDVRQALGELSARLTAEGRRHQIQLRSYAELPTIHGFYVRRPTVQRYISFCRWIAGPRYDWGEFRYHQVSGEPTTAAQKDLVEIFDGQFRYLWKTSEAVGDWPERR